MRMFTSISWIGLWVSWEPRGLRSIVEAIMMDAMFSMPSEKEKKLHVTLGYAKEKFEKSDVNRLQIA